MPRVRSAGALLILGSTALACSSGVPEETTDTPEAQDAQPIMVRDVTDGPTETTGIETVVRRPGDLYFEYQTVVHWLEIVSDSPAPSTSSRPTASSPEAAGSRPCASGG